ncbi:MAG: hypothetical protein KJ941_02930 [Bacteroidetes bacterium]|nr:hypothetical protein [Bacteroidota bacterium]
MDEKQISQLTRTTEMNYMEKKKKNLVKKILKWSGLGVLLLLIIAILIPILFKDKLKDMVLEEANKSLTAKVDIGDFDLTFIQTFPNLTIQLFDTKIAGTGDFEGTDLINAKNIRAEVKLWDVISGDKIAIRGIYLDGADINVKVLKDGKANYDITIPDTTTVEEPEDDSNFKMSLQKYVLSNTNIEYDDREGDMYASIKNLNHEGKGDLTADIIDFETFTSMDELTYEMEGLSYLSKVKTEADVGLKMEFTEKTSKFILKENVFKLNNLQFGLNGFYEMLEGYDQMDLSLDASKATFKDFLSLIPTFYQSGYESMITKGNLAMNGKVAGRMDEKSMPGWDFKLNVDNASIKYPDVPGTINNIVLKAGSTFKGGENMDLMTLDVTKFHADFVGNVLDATLKMRNPMTDPLIQSDIVAKVDLGSLGKVMPMAEGESYSGKLDADVHLNGRLSAIETEKYEEFEALGTLKLMDMLYKSPDLPEPVNISTMLFAFSPKNLSLKEMNAKMGVSDFQISGTIDNYLGYAFRDELLKGQFDFTSANLDLNQLMGSSTETTTTTESSETSTPAEESSEPLLIPGNVDFLLNTKIGKMKYDGMDITDVRGMVRVKDEVASMNDVNMNMLGGNIGLNGSYSSVNPDKPAIDLGYNLKNISIPELVKNFTSIETMAPIAKYAKGNISSNFAMKGALKPSLEPIFSSLTGNGDLFTNAIEISGFKPLEKISEALKMTKLKTQTLNDVKAFFTFVDGKVNLKPFDVKMGKILTNIHGYTSFDQDINYDLLMNIPKEEIPASMIQLAENAMSKVNNVVPKLNVGSLPAVIPVKVNLLGKVSDPKITTDMKEALLKASGNLKDNLVNTGKDLLNKGVDSVKNIAKDKVNDVKEDLNAKRQAILADAQKQADKVKAEAKKLADATRAEGAKQGDALIAEAGSNPIKKKGAEIAANKLKKEAEEKAQRIEKEAEAKADKIMSEAREKSDKLN